MSKSPLILVWLGIVILSGMFLIGQDTWETCQDNDGDGYGNPASSTCRNPGLDCHDDPHNDPAFCSDVCASCDQDEFLCAMCAKCIPGAILDGEETHYYCYDGVDNDCDGFLDWDEPYSGDISSYMGFFEVTYDDITDHCPFSALGEGFEVYFYSPPDPAYPHYIRMNRFTKGGSDDYTGHFDWHEPDRHMGIWGDWYPGSPPPNCSPSYRLTGDIFFDDTNNFQGTLRLDFTYHLQCGLLPCYVDAAIEGRRFFRKCDGNCCGEYVPCGKPGCYCWLTTEGDSVCADDPLIDCEYLQTCSGSLDCPSGQRCITCGCCPGNVCMPDTCI